ncbi:WS/DGAT domain-containing protein [Leifsonia sp. McL0607]|uniref:WS/DGAT domain-containing protein n=1 Tax=Leifsonia sp. McL0607 TaxID=3415672 RepID=UPI003CF44E9C
MGRRSAPAGAIAAVDAANFALEGAQPNVVTLAGLLAPGGFVDRRGVPDLDRLRAVLSQRVLSVPALCRRPTQKRAAWTWEPAAPDLAHHVRVWRDDEHGGPRRTAAGEPHAFEALCAEGVMRRLPLDRPLWELLLLPSVEGRRCGVLFRLHHAVADGLEAESLIAALADGRPTGGPSSPEHTSALVAASGPEHAPARERIREAAEQTIAVFRRTVRSRVLLGRLGTTRDVAFLDVDLGELHDGARRSGGTVGDAFLTAFGQGLRALLTAAGEELPTTLPISCPVQLRRRPGAGNATGVMLVPVPVATSDVREALAVVAAATRSEKTRARAAGTFGWMAGPRSAALLMRFARSQRAVAAIASEFPGPPRTLTFAGSELVSAWPLSLLSANVRVGAVGASYAGRFRVAVQTDAENLPSARVVADAMSEALRAIAGSSRPCGPGPTGAPPSAGPPWANPHPERPS